MSHVPPRPRDSTKVSPAASLARSFEYRHKGKGFGEALDEEYRNGWNEAIDRAVQLVRERMGERLFDGSYKPASPDVEALLADLQRRRYR